MTPSKNSPYEAMNSDEISAILWELDPMKTGCSDCDEMRNEYEFQAEEIASLMKNGIPLRTAVVEVFDKWFWEDCLASNTDTSRIDAIVKKIESKPTS